MTDTHFEPFLHLAGLGDDEALLAWGGFHFRRADGGSWRLVDDEELPEERRRGVTGTIGATSPPYGRAVVEVEREGQTVARAETSDANWAWVRGLEPDAEHRYRVVVDGQEWAAGERLDWDAAAGTLAPLGRRYDNRFRTFPAAGDRPPVTFAVIGDFGVGILHENDDSGRQLQVARALERAVETHGVRLVLTVGDNVYLGPEDGVAGSGDEDDDWYASFYEPYRYVVNRVPFFPAIGNHDTSDSEQSDDRDQLTDNFFLDHRFRREVEEGRASLDPGLFYRFRVGGSLEFVAVDTSVADELEGFEHYFQAPEHERWLRDSLLAGEGGPAWLIPFSHHPPFCAGPRHGNTEPMVEHLVPLFAQAGVRLVLSGHEHNFQYSVVDGIHYVVSGAAGKLRGEAPDDFGGARTRAWAPEPHFLLVHADEKRIVVDPVGSVDGDGSLRPIELRAPDGKRVERPLEVSRTP
jgi:predicted phosphodiesterase